MKKRLVKGKDWHAWAWERKDGKLRAETWTEKPQAAAWIPPHWGEGQWVRVKLVKVEK